MGFILAATITKDEDFLRIERPEMLKIEYWQLTVSKPCETSKYLMSICESW